jgi:hypothetical protein
LGRESALLKRSLGASMASSAAFGEFPEFPECAAGGGKDAALLLSGLLLEDRFMERALSCMCGEPRPTSVRGLACLRVHDWDLVVRWGLQKVRYWHTQRELNGERGR